MPEETTPTTTEETTAQDSGIFTIPANKTRLEVEQELYKLKTDAERRIRAAENAEARANTAIEKAKVLEQQVKKEAETYAAKAKADLAGEFQKFEEQKAAIVPELAKLEKTREEVNALLSQQATEKTQLENEKKRQELVSYNQDEIAATLRDKEAALTKQIADNARNAEIGKSALKADRDKFEQQLRAHEGHVAAENARLFGWEDRLKKQQEELDQKSDSVGVLQQQAADAKVKLDTEIKQREEVAGALEAKNAAELAEIATSKGDLEKREATVAEETNRNAEKAAQLETLRAGLEKAKIDIETAQMKVQKQQMQVDALIEHHGLKAELEALNPAVDAPADPGVKP